MIVTHRQITASDIKLSSATEADLFACLGALPKSHTIRLFANFSALVWNVWGSDDVRDLHEIQVEILNVLSASATAQQLLTMVNANDSLAFIEPEQAALAVKFALLYCSNESIGPGLLQSAQHCENIVKALIILNTLVVEAQVRLAERNSLALALRIANSQRRERLANTIGRYYHFFNWAKFPEAQGSSEYLPLREDFERLLGYDVDEYLFVWTALYTQVGSLRHVADLGKQGAVVSLDTLLNGTTERERIAKIIQDNAIDASELSSTFESKGDNNFSNVSLMPLLSKPFIRLENGDICIVSPKYVENGFGPSLFHRLADAYKNDGGDKARGRFSSFFGNYFESYVTMLVREAMVANGRVITEQTFKGRLGSEVKSTDVVVLEDDQAVFIEVVAKRLQAVKTIRNTDPASMRRDLDAMLVEKFEEISNRLEDFRQGFYSLDGANWSEVHRIFPVVVVVEPMFLELGIIKDVRNRLAGRAGLSDAEPIQILDIEGLEALCYPLQQGDSLSGILSKKCSNAATSDKDMTDYLISSGARVAPTEQMRSRTQAAFCAIHNKARLAGVPGSDEVV